MNATSGIKLTAQVHITVFAEDDSLMHNCVTNVYKRDSLGVAARDKDLLYFHGLSTPAI